MTSQPAPTRIRLWDLPTRLVHWSLVLAVLTAFVTGQLGGSWMSLHAKAGLTIVGLVVFRLLWGVVGSTYARFSNFVPTPGKISAYLKGQWHGVGHNPLGALSVLALLGLLALQSATGLFANDDIDFSGPLAAMVETSLSGRLTSIHAWLVNGLIALVLLHVAAIIFYTRVKKDKLLKPMFTGWKEVASGASASPVGLTAFAVSLAVAVAAVYGASGAILAWITT
jgi:cytochrome b